VNALYVDEVNPALIPTEMTEGLSESLLFEKMVYSDDDVNAWLGIVGINTESYCCYFQVIVKNEKIVLRERL